MVSIKLCSHGWAPRQWILLLPPTSLLCVVLKRSSFISECSSTASRTTRWLILKVCSETPHMRQVRNRLQPNRFESQNRQLAAVTVENSTNDGVFFDILN